MTTTDTKTATEAAAVAETAAQSAPSKDSSKQKAKPAKTTPTAKRGAKKATTKKAATKKATPAAAVRTGSKKQIVLDLLRRKDGATMTEIAKTTGWQHHSIRGFISGTAGKRMGLTVESTKNDAGDRVYHIAK